MMRLPEFSYLAPVSVGDAVKLMADHGPSAMLVAGGTDLYPNMKRRQFEPSVLVGLRGIRELHGVRGSYKTGLTIGAGSTLTAVSTHAEVSRHYPGLATAAHLVSSPQLRNMGTLGGNVCVDTRCNYYNQSYEWRKAVNFCMKKDGEICLVAPGSSRCWAVSSSDTAPMLWSLGAKVRLVGPTGERLIPISSLYRDDGIEYLSRQPGEILTEIVLPPSEGWRSTYLKLRRRGSFDFPVLGVAVALRMEGEMVREAAITLGAVASQPRPAPEAAALLAGRPLTPEVIDAVADAAFKPGKPLDNTDLTHPYRKKMIRVFVARALHALAHGDPGATSADGPNHLAHGDPAPTPADGPNHLTHGQPAKGQVELK
jgi:4-hydroxybenzoyl-CoA reductase subunit beta